MLVLGVLFPKSFVFWSKQKSKKNAFLGYFTLLSLIVLGIYVTTRDHIPVEFVRVVDGDTAKIIYEGREEYVRYLLIDTPESKSHHTCVQPYGEEASIRNEELLNSGKVTLEFDGPKRDTYGRLLAYVYVDGESVQEKLIKEGYGRVAYVYDPPYTYLEDYYQAEEDAKTKRRKIWSQEGYVTQAGFTGCVDD